MPGDDHEEEQVRFSDRGQAGPGSWVLRKGCCEELQRGVGSGRVGKVRGEGAGGSGGVGKGCGRDRAGGEGMVCVEGEGCGVPRRWLPRRTCSSRVTHEECGFKSLADVSDEPRLQDFMKEALSSPQIDRLTSACKFCHLSEVC